MNETKPNKTIQYAVVITYLGMILVNALANILPINGITTGDVSDAYPNLFAPAGITFAIWGVIYLLLAGYTVYQLGILGKKTPATEHAELLDRVGTLFTVSSVANILWIFAWHYRMIAVSQIFMTVILICLILINLRTHREDLTATEKLLVRLPFSVYFGWISVATIANVTTLLVDIGWDGFGVAEGTWTVMILLVGIAIGILTTVRLADIAYGLVFVWAYSGILLKHVSPEFFDFAHPAVVYTAMASIIFMLVAIILVVMKRIRREKATLRSL